VAGIRILTTEDKRRSPELKISRKGAKLRALAKKKRTFIVKIRKTKEDRIF